MSYIYVASPYSNRSTLIRLERYHAVKRYMVKLFRARRPAYSPIMHWHQAALEYELPWDHEPWTIQDEALLAQANAMHVLTLPGWEESRGVQHEIKIWKSIFGEPTLIDPENLNNVIATEAASFSRIQS